MMKKSPFLKAVSVLLCVALVLVSVPLMVSAATKSASFSVISDIHYLAGELYDESAKAWQVFDETDAREFQEGDSLIANAFELTEKYLEQAKRSNSAYVLIPGDLTKDGEYLSHVALAKKFKAFEEETGIPVYVVPGNHDILNSNGRDFTGDKQFEARRTQPEEFAEIYADFGYNEAHSRFVPKEGNLGGGLSYSVELDSGYFLIGVDSCMYSVDNGTETDEHLTDGRVGDDLLEWIKDQCAYAKSKGLEIVLFQHHNVVPHMDIEEATFFAFVIEDWQRICDVYADSGIHYVFTGHLHALDTASYVNDNGERINDILTSTLTSYPNEIRIAEFTSDSNGLTCNVTSHEADEITPVTAVHNGKTVTYEKPFKDTYSFGQTFGYGGAGEFVTRLLQGLVDSYFPEILEAGGLIGFLKEKGIDLEEIIINALGTDGLAIGDLDILTVSGNLMSLINDLGSQIDEKFISDPDYCMEVVGQILNKLLTLELSEYPCSAIIEETGIGSTDKPGTLDEFASLALYNYYGGDEQLEDDPFVTDVLERFESGELAKKVFDLLREVVVNDLAEDLILSNLDFNPGELFPKGTALHVLGIMLQKLTEVLLGGDNSFMNLVSSVLGLAVVPEAYSSVDNILDTLVLDEYLTESQYQGWGHTISWMLSTLVLDTNPDTCLDGEFSFTYSGKEAVEATAENFRLPSNINVTLGEDSTTSANITWYTKYSIENTDIQIVPYTADFTSSNVECTADCSCEILDRGYPGADLGIFGLLQYDTEYAKHIVRLSGLTPGTKYKYRVGDSERGWWSEPAVLETADGGDKFTFIHVSDMQSQNETQYQTFNSVMNAAFAKYPEAKLVVSSGDQVDLGTHFRQWQYLFNVNSAYFMNTYFMPTTGNHEKEGEVLTTNFTLPNVAQGQNLDTGCYYSYDYNNVHFTVLNTNDDEDDKLSKEQMNWLINDISSSNAKWKIVVLHKAAYSNGSHYDDKEVKGIRKQLCAALPTLGVDLVLEGHDHVYLRTDVMNGNLIVPTVEKDVTYNGETYSMKVNPKGTIYSIPGTSGVKVYKVKDSAATDKLFPRAECLVNADSPMFSAITVDGDRLYYNSYKVVDGEVQRADNFAIEKTSSACTAKQGVSGFFAKVLAKLNLPFFWRIISFVFPFVSKLFDVIYK